MKVDLEGLKEFLIEKLVSEVDNEWCTAFRESGPATGEITDILVGSWLCI